MGKKECVAMVLAGGRGKRLGALTSDVAKPAVIFGGNYRMIDFVLSNCKHSEIDTVGVLTQYLPLELHTYIDKGQIWDLDKKGGGVYMYPPQIGRKYSGTANAVYQNMDFIEEMNPENVLILSSDHIYKMDYRKMLDFHINKGADVTIAATSVPMEEASRFGILSTSDSGFIYNFDEKPQKPKSTLASMGIYIFKWARLKEYLSSGVDFGKDVIPAMLSANEKLYTYKFDGYWKDVGTVHSLWEANMDLIHKPHQLNLDDNEWKIFTSHKSGSPTYISGEGEVKHSIISKSCNVYGKVENSILSDSVYISEGAEVTDSVIMPNVFIGRNTKIHKAVVGANASILVNVEIGANCGTSLFVDKKICSEDISLIAPGAYISSNIKFYKNSHINELQLSDGIFDTYLPVRFDLRFDRKDLCRA